MREYRVMWTAMHGRLCSQVGAVRDTPAGAAIERDSRAARELRAAGAVTWIESREVSLWQSDEVDFDPDRGEYRSRLADASGEVRP